MKADISLESVKLLNGKIIKRNSYGVFEAMHVFDDKCIVPCNVCPINLLCLKDNFFDCWTYAMFDGCNFDFENILDFCNELRNEKLE